MSMIFLGKMLAGCAGALLITTAACAESGFYARLQGGKSYQNSFSFGTVSSPPPNIGTVTHKSGNAFGGALGYRVHPNVRAELEVTIRDNKVSTVDFTGTPFPFIDGDTRSTVTMVNAYYDLKTKTPFTPYVGGGIGMARITFENYRPEVAPTTSVSGGGHRFAYQAMLGILYDISPRIALNLEYRYLKSNPIPIYSTLGDVDASADYENDSALVGITYKF